MLAARPARKPAHACLLPGCWLRMPTHGPESCFSAASTTASTTACLIDCVCRRRRKVRGQGLARRARRPLAEREGQAGAVGRPRVRAKGRRLAPGAVQQRRLQLALHQGRKGCRLGALRGRQPAVQINHLHRGQRGHCPHYGNTGREVGATVGGESSRGARGRARAKAARCSAWAGVRTAFDDWRLDHCKSGHRCWLNAPFASGSRSLPGLPQTRPAGRAPPLCRCLAPPARSRRMQQLFRAAVHEETLLSRQFAAHSALAAA